MRGGRESGCYRGGPGTRRRTRGPRSRRGDVDARLAGLLGFLLSDLAPARSRGRSRLSRRRARPTADATRHQTIQCRIMTYVTYVRMNATTRGGVYLQRSARSRFRRETNLNARTLSTPTPRARRAADARSLFSPAARAAACIMQRAPNTHKCPRPFSTHAHARTSHAATPSRHVPARRTETHNPQTTLNGHTHAQHAHDKRWYHGGCRTIVAHRARASPQLAAFMMLAENSS